MSVCVYMYVCGCVCVWVCMCVGVYVVGVRGRCTGVHVSVFVYTKQSRRNTELL